MYSYYLFSQETLDELKKRVANDIIVPISAKHGGNLSELLSEIRSIYDTQMARRKRQMEKDCTAASYLPLA